LNPKHPGKKDIRLSPSLVNSHNHLQKSTGIFATFLASQFLQRSLWISLKGEAKLIIFLFRAIIFVKKINTIHPLPHSYHRWPAPGIVAAGTEPPGAGQGKHPGFALKAPFLQKQLNQTLFFSENNLLKHIRNYPARSLQRTESHPVQRPFPGEPCKGKKKPRRKNLRGQKHEGKGSYFFEKLALI
jgi:hypothetical protein